MITALLLAPVPALAAPSRVVIGDVLPTTLNPLYAEHMADLRAQQLVFERLWYNSAIT